MDIIGKEVRHKKLDLGIGTILERMNNNCVIVKFESKTMTMPYPDVFKEHLAFTDVKLQNEIMDEIAKNEEAKAAVVAEKARKQEENRKKMEAERRREITVAKRKTGRKSSRPCIAFKLNYCDGGSDEKYAGFYGICSDEMIELNIRKKRAWCSDSDCKCSQFIEGEISENELCKWWDDNYCGKFVCYDSVVLRDWAFSSAPGTFIRSAEPGHLCVFTTQLPTKDYKDFNKERVVVGISIIESVEDDENDSSRVYSLMDDEYLLSFNIEEARRFKYWDIAHGERNPNNKWASGLVRNFDDDMAIDFLKKAIEIKSDKAGKDKARNFLKHYCEINNLDASL